MQGSILEDSIPTQLASPTSTSLSQPSQAPNNDFALYRGIILVVFVFSNFYSYAEATTYLKRT